MDTKACLSRFSYSATCSALFSRMLLFLKYCRYASLTYCPKDAFSLRPGRSPKNCCYASRPSSRRSDSYFRCGRCLPNCRSASLTYCLTGGSDLRPGRFLMSASSVQAATSLKDDSSARLVHF